jgi:hypothetical protein
VALSLFSVSLFGQDSVIFVNRKTDKLFRVGEGTVFRVKMKDGKKQYGILFGQDKSLLILKIADTSANKEMLRKDLQEIQENQSLTPKEKQQEMTNLIYSDTGYFNYDSIKNIKIFRKDKAAKKLVNASLVLLGATLGYTAMTIVLDHNNNYLAPIHTYIPIGFLATSLVLYVKSYKKKITPKKWRLRVIEY